MLAERRAATSPSGPATSALYDLGAIIGPLDGDWWRLVAAQFVYENVGYLFAVAVAVAIFGTSLERRYGAPVLLASSSAGGAAGMYLASEAVNFPLAMGGNAVRARAPVRLAVRDLRDRRAGDDPRPTCSAWSRSPRCSPRCRCSRSPPTPGPASRAPWSDALAGLLLPKR